MHGFDCEANGLTGKLSARAAAFVVHENEVVGGFPGGPSTDLVPSSTASIWLIHSYVEQVHRPPEVERHLLVERSEST